MIDFNNETYEIIKSRMLNNVDLDVDDRETGVIDASISPTAIELARLYALLTKVQNNGFILTATDEALDYICLMRGLTRKQATKSIRMAYFNLLIDENVEFSTIGLNDALIYKTIEEATPYVEYYFDILEYTSGTDSDKTNIGIYYATDTNKWYKEGQEIEVESVLTLPEASADITDKYYYTTNNQTLFIGKQNDLYRAKVECETSGTIGNDYIGNIIPLTNINGLTIARINEVVEEGTDIESDNSLKIRYLATLGNEAFSGNITAYRTYTLGIDGVGAVQVYPHYNGAGTVKISIINANYNVADSSLIERVQNLICPPEEEGNTPSPLGYGMSPIGAKVDVGTATELDIDVEFDVELTQGATASSIQTKVEAKIQEFLLGIRTEWGNALMTNKIEYPVNVYRARLTSALLEISEILNISNLKLNNELEDVLCIEKADLTASTPVDLQQLPVMGTVTINEV